MKERFWQLVSCNSITHEGLGLDVGLCPSPCGSVPRAGITPSFLLHSLKRSQLSRGLCSHQELDDIFPNTLRFGPALLSGPKHLISAKGSMPGRSGDVRS